MLKIYVKSTIGSTVMFNDSKIEDHLEDVESILSSVASITNNVPHRYTEGLCPMLSGTIFIELSLVDENIGNIRKIIDIEHVLNNVKN